MMKGPSQIPRRVFLAALACALAALSPVQAADGWEVFERTEEGYEIARRPVPGRDLPRLRGRGVLRGDLFHVLAVLLDASRAPEWAEGVSRTKVLESERGVATLVYSYTDLTWPVSDRDAVTRARLTVVERGREYQVQMIGEPDAHPRVEGAIRIEHTHAHFVVKRRGKGKVWIEYVVDVDPGGRLPTWLVRWASKSVPGDTLRKLQRQVDATRGDYDGLLAKLRAWPYPGR